MRIFLLPLSNIFSENPHRSAGEMLWNDFFIHGAAMEPKRVLQNIIGEELDVTYYMKEKGLGSL
jgi:hypothetical protein